MGGARDGAQVEEISGKKRRPVADYVLARTDRAPDGSPWEEWLQTHRVELNAMTTPHFIAWLDRKMAQHGTIKLIPPTEVMAQELDERVEDKVRAAITERILREAGLDDQVAAAVAAIEPKKPGGAELAKGIERLFKREQDQPWRDHVEAVASPADEAAFLKMARFLAGPVTTVTGIAKKRRFLKNEEEKAHAQQTFG